MSPRKPNWFRAPFTRLRSSDQGAVAPLIGLMMIVLVGSTGIAVDIGRSMVVKARLGNALDAAGLAVGARVGTTDFTADAKKFVTANFASNYAGATVKDVVATSNASKTVITLSASADMPTAFMRLFGTDMVSVRATSEVTRASTGLELVLALDNTSSMAGDMATLKLASHTLVNLVFGDKTTGENLYVGIVPFSQAVNVGYPLHKAWMDDDHAKTQVPKEYQSQWPAASTGCAEARLSGLDQTDDLPVKSNKSTLFRYYLYPYNNETKGNWTSEQNYLDQKGWAKDCPQAMLPMTNDKNTIDAAIDTMKATGYTHINLGAVWGWRMLSPKWRGSWGGDMTKYSLPLDYNTKNMTKAVVIMTDGENKMIEKHYTAYGFLTDGRLGTTNSPSKAIETLDARLKKVCEDMKKTGGINVFTVAFRNPDTTTKALLQNCASNIDFYFDSATPEKLQKDFKTIGASLSNLRVSR